MALLEELQKVSHGHGDTGGGEVVALSRGLQCLGRPIPSSLGVCRGLS